MSRIYASAIRYHGRLVTLACDGKCAKAWGINQRERAPLSRDEDDYEWLADDELGTAPSDPGTYEGGDGKPSSPLGMNKWCARECERSVIVLGGMPIVLNNFAVRIRNVSA